MDSDTKSLVISIVGSIIGVAIIYYIVIKPAVQLQQSNQLWQYQQYQQQPNQLQQHQQQYQQTQPLTQPSIPNSYKNSEKWEITRNRDGFISNIRVSRDARVTN